jgi:hypothetical protein
MSQAIEDVVFERERQKTVERWSKEHDDQHVNGELARAAACYAYEAGRTDYQRDIDGNEPPMMWPWSAEWWKPTNRRRDLIKAGAMILAEIERIDRAKQD